MGTLLIVLALLIIGTFLMVRIATWASNISPLFRNIVAFCLAGASSYAVGFVFNMWVLAATNDIIPASNVVWPTFTWLSIAFASIIAAFQAVSSPYALAIPFFLNAMLVIPVAPSKVEVIFIAIPLLLVGIATFLYQRYRLQHRKDGRIIDSFPIGIYKLNDSIEDVTGLVEFSPAEYSTMGRQFVDERNYNAPHVRFLDRLWKLMLQTVHGQICKIALYQVSKTESEANTIAMHILQYCTEQLGKPATQQTGLFVWDTKDGNVVLQTAKTTEEFSVALFLTSSAIRNFKLL